jgi:hypothetical protein
LRAEGRKRKLVKQAVCKNHLILKINTWHMKFFLSLMVAIVFSNTYAQERKSEKATEHIDFSKSDARRTWVKESINTRTAYYGAQNETMPVTMRLAAQKTPLKNVTPFLSYFLTWEETSNDENNSSVRIRFFSRQSNMG